ncbi:tesmin TSO1-like CXC domain protein (macronuclear) [Tetrahymena thermophila SB210]|uniref:Tesmin TSO1-like CXC domain protein n=1 Tax=Tetrahymena thermophila (strain SB210) TaxID=312017 RepID=Q24BV9_TETTS|nr:tesmin TSO1-like CXC domain protein [Tetrahymena thermophila SB210]EAS05278.2 tesmin TSO1-like CXC domain protein [Tetrahymena thermophila SB210]|eukprot:XP_001025523.2 tesmin TSO1-like CXC domain protein [Tetrahymena thermophila SB210]
MKDSTKSNLQTPKKEGFTRYDKTPSAKQMISPISEKKINAAINDNQAIFKSPMIGGNRLITGQNLSDSPNYQGYDGTPFQPLSFPGEYPPSDIHFHSPFKRDFTSLVHPIIHTQNAYHKLQQYTSNPSSPFQEKNNIHHHHQPEFVLNNYFQQHEETGQVENQNGEEQKNTEKQNIETDLIFSEQNGISLLACETLIKDVRDQEPNASGTVIMKKPKFIIEFENETELQNFKESDEFKQLISKINFSENYFQFEIPSNEQNFNGKSLFSTGSRYSKKSFSSQRTPPFKGQISNRYISPNPYFQFMMKKNLPYQYSMNSYYYSQEMPPQSNSPNVKNNILHRNLNHDTRVVPRQDGPFASNKSASLVYQNKQLGKLLFDNNHEKEISDNENSDSQEQIKNVNNKSKKQEGSSEDQSPQQDSKYNSVQKQTRKILKENDDKNDIFEDTNTINFPLNEYQKQSLKDKHKKIHNKANTTFLQQQIQKIKKSASYQEQSQNASQEMNEDIEEVQLKNPILLSSAKRKIEQQNETQNDQINDKSVNLNSYSQTTAKKARSISKNDSSHQDSINKKRRHFDTPNVKKNEFSTPSTKKKYDSQQQQSNQDLVQNKKSSSKNHLDSKTQSSKNNRSQQSQQKQNEKMNSLVSDFSNEVQNNLKNQAQFNNEDDNNHSHSDLMCDHDHDHEHHQRSELQDRDMMAEDEDLRDDDDLQDEENNLQDIDENDKKECCGCKKTKCLKLYCECFQAMKYCVGTNCQGCLNKPEYEDQRKHAMELIQQRNSSAFDPKADKSDQYYKSDSGTKAIHSKGCNCKKSDCRKKYCECYQMGAKCTHLCKCYNCKNRHDSNPHYFSGSKQGMPIHSLYIDGVPSHIPPPPLPHLLGVPHQYPFRGSNQAPPVIFQYPSMYHHHPHSIQNYGMYDSWNYYHPDYNIQRQGESSNNNSNNQNQQGQQNVEFDNTPRFNSIKRQQPMYQKSNVSVKDFQNSVME